ncbi:MAG: hypothetical protein JWN24_61 [Phycisphaerales bacterium]|jgi:hypothetical protein|nr:hypothetical protein [Phycisphaerales bacterium]
MAYLKANWPHVLLTLLGAVASSAFALGFAWAVLGGRVATAERRLDEIDKAHVAETGWQVQQHAASLTSLQAEARANDAQIAQINTRLGVIDAKLDAIADTLKARSAAARAEGSAGR